MNHANNVPLSKWRYKLFAKAFKTATLLDGLHVIELDGKADTRIKHEALYFLVLTTRSSNYTLYVAILF
jgi:hypothetical protein